MAVIEDVPPEILSKILLHVINGLYVHQRARFMCSLSTLSRQFYFVLQPLIFRRVHIAFQPGPARCALLFRSLNEDPSLIEMVHDLGVSWLLPVREKPNNEADELLKILTSLRSLLIHSKWNHEHFPTQFLDVNPMRNLTTVTLRGLQLTPDDIRKYLVLDHVEHMTIGCPFVGDFSESIDIDGKTSRLLSLYIHSASHIPPELLLNILKICPKIVELRCAPPGRGVQQGLDDSTLRLGDRLSPELISKALSPSKSTLQRLELVPSPCEWPGHDGSRMDLSMMKALRYIHCPSQCFFIPRTPFNTRVGLYGLLPSCLEELSVREVSVEPFSTNYALKRRFILRTVAA